MSLPPTFAEGSANLPSRHSVKETIDRLQALLEAKGIKVFLRLDQAAEARAAGLNMPATELLVFGDPRAGTPLMVKHPSVALDLPVKALAWEAADHSVWLTSNTPEYLMARHHLEAPPLAALAGLFLAATQ